ncbi:M15 family metallopeptidase [Microbacterium sp. B2969]|uniref:M15 family metallopeptidase n=1 Tax=Microbacterium alkaliflavum TaxID=3248839 RepID=A0ABW7Q319_9MICO
MSVLRPSLVRSNPPGRRVAFVAVGAVVAVTLAVGLWAVMFVQAGVLAAPYAPRVDDGFLAEPVTLGDADVAAISNLDPALLAAVREAEAAASVDGVSFEVTSGWRTARYQQWLLEDAVKKYGSTEIALQWVAAPDRSHHVTGRAVDIGPLDAQSWLIAHGAAWGLCQIYANERWHFELATEPGGACPALLENAAG